MSFSTIAIAASAKAGIQSKEDANIIEFVEAPWGLGMTLFPVQKVILKAHYGLELDDTKKFKISDWRRENWKELTEKEYLKHIYDDGRCNIGEVVPGTERREMVLSIGRRSGKCVLGDTLVLTDNGIFRIDQLGDTNGGEFQPLKVTIAQEGKEVTSQSEFFYNGGVKPVFKFKTHCGYRLGGTGNHRIKVLSDNGDIEWRYLSDLKLGDIVCIHRDTNLWGKNNSLSIEEAIALGDKDFVPSIILYSSSEIVSAYIQGVFKDSKVIYSINEEYKHQLQILLLNLGIVSKCDSNSLSILDVDKTDSYYYDPVTEITTDVQPVYDLNVPNGSMFVANGMTNHNTTISACIAAYETYKLIKKTDPQAYYGLPASNNIQIISVATDKDQAGLLYNEVSGHFRNCFAYDTEIITDQGVKKIGDVAGTEQILLTRDGSWVKAPIRSFGKQKLYKLTLMRQGVDKVIYTTENHRWYARDARARYKGKGFIEFKTSELRKDKHRLQSVFGRSFKNRIDPSPFGIAHGFTYGDGSTNKGDRNANEVHLIGDKDKALLPYFSMCPIKEKPYINGIKASALPNFFRELPSINENKSYLLGWLMGYFAADGCASNGQIDISSIDKKNIEFFRDVCILLGIGTYDIRTETRMSNLNNKEFTMYRMKLMRQTLDESFFIIEKHKQEYIEAGASDVKRKVIEWAVKDIEETDRFEEVYCATVEGHGNFTLDGNIVTGNCAFFGPYTANNTQSYARFQTPKDVERYGRYIEDPTAKATLKVTFRSCVAKGLRGAGNICVIMDEIAHFTETGQSGAEEVYNAVVPSTSAYSPKDPTDRRIPVGPVEGRVISISSPLGKQGLFYKLFQIGMQGGKASSNMLCVQAPTWEVNPTVPATEFEKHYLKNPTVFFTEYGGEFTDRTRGWIEDSKDLLKCVNPKRTAVDRGIAKKPHFVGIDLALVGDGTAIAIGHVEDDKIVLDKIDMIKAGVGKFVNKDRLDFDDVADWVLDYSKKFYITEGIFDQWAGIPFEQALQKRGLGQMKTVNMTKQITSQMFQNFKDMMWDERLELYDKPNAESTNQHEAYLNELMELQSTVHSKNLITVEAPQVDGKHDDMSDALVRMVWIASQNVGKQKTIYTAGGSGLGGMYSPKRGGDIYFGRSPGLGSSTGRVAPKLPTSRGGSLRDRIIGRR